MLHRPLWILISCFLILTIARPGRAQESTPQDLGRLVIQAEAYEKAGKQQQAIDAYGRAGRLAAQLFGPMHIYVAAMTQAQGNLYRNLGQYEKARVLLEQALKISEAAKDTGMTAEGINNLAAVHWELANYQQARELHERANRLLIAEYGDEGAPVAVSRSNLAGVYKSLGEYSLAEPLYLRAIQVLEKNREKYPLQFSDALMNLADLYTQQGEFTRSEPLLVRSIAIKEQAVGPEHYEVGRTLNNLAALHVSLGQYEKAEEMYQRSLRIISTSLGADHIDVARGWLNLAGLYQRWKQYEKAEELYERAIELRRKKLGNDHPDVALTLHNWAGLYFDLRKFDRSDELYREALELREKRLGADHPTVAYTLMALARLRLEQKRFDDAEAMYRRALDIRTQKLPKDHPDLAYAYFGLGLVAAATGHWEAAAQDFDRARHGFRRYIDQVLPTLSESEQLTFLREVDEQNYHVALSLALRAPQPDELAEVTAGFVVNGKAISQQALAQRALMARDTRNPALAVLARSLQALRKQLASLAFVGGDDRQQAERRTRFETLSRQEQDQAQKLARMEGRPAGAGNWTELGQVRAALNADAVLLECARFRNYDFRDLLKDKSDVPEHYVVWVIPSAPEQATEGANGGAVRVVDLGDADAIDAAVKEARTALQNAPQQLRDLGEPEAEQELRPVLQKLAKLILDPLLPHLEKRPTIYLSPDSMLWLVPWSALPLDKDTYAIEKFDIRYVVSGRDLVKSDMQFKPDRPIMFADPNYDLNPGEVRTATETLFRGVKSAPSAVRATPGGTSRLGMAARLPGTKAEASAVRPKLESYAGVPAYVYSDQWALEAVFKALRQPRVLVVSTHGFFQQDDDAEEVATETAGETRGNSAAAARDPGNPLLRCGLLLAGCNRPPEVSQADSEDGILTGLEIASTDLRGTELVVLSACETGLGEVRNGEGVAGLRQAFQLAGAKSVIATLWQIPDRETARLMTEFFGNLAASNDKPAALRTAQIHLIESRRERNAAAHPFFWAAFTITGE